MASRQNMAAVGRIGGLVTASRHDPVAMTAPAREGWLRRFLREVDPDGVLPEDERQRRAEAAQRAQMSRLALKSAEARRKKARA
jgi:hypothetical protein